MNNESFFEGSHLVVSYELLQFLRWIITNEPEALNVLIRQACEEGVLDSGAPSETSAGIQDAAHHEELRQSVIDFFDLLELKLHETRKENEAPTPNQAFRPAVDSIDSSLCDENTVSLSVAQATSQLTLNTPQHAKETLYKELLKNWKPRNKHLLH